MQYNNRTIIIGLAVVVLAIAGVAWYAWHKTDDAAHLDIPGEPERVTNEPQSLEFTYYGGPDGYTLLESWEDTDLGDPNLVKAYTIVKTADYTANGGTPTGVGNKIPAITILVFNEASSTVATTTGSSTEPVPGPTLREWAEAHRGFTAYGLKTGDAVDARVDNVGAISYTSEGPFASETYVVKYRNKYYVIIGQYQTLESDIRKAFEKLLTQIYFL
jgi:hypothetical protein